MDSYEHFRAVLADLTPLSEWADAGLDLTHTPERWLRAMRQELLAGYSEAARKELDDGFTVFGSDGKDSMVVEGPVDFASLCAHHLLPFTGQAFVGYTPKDFLAGASKIPRAVQHFGRMLQNQERMTRQIAEYLYDMVRPHNVVVTLVAGHACMQCRGVLQRNTKMVTCAVRPMPIDRALLDEYHRLVALLE